MKALRALDSMSGRIFAMLLIGIALAATLGVALSEQRRVAEVRHLQAIRAIERMGRFLNEFDAKPVAKRPHEAKEARSYVRLAVGGDMPMAPNADLSQVLRAQVPAGVVPTVADIPLARCDLPVLDDDAEPDKYGTPPPDAAVARAWKNVVASTDCWRVAVRLSDGTSWTFVTEPPPLLKASNGPDPAFLAVIALAAAVLAFVVARSAGAPLRHLARAADSMTPEAELPPLAETGPSEVRGAIKAFNQMQQRLLRHASEQTHMIAAITHDLQTPMTRLRLKLEQMDDATGRDRLLSDWRAMRAIVEEGLELARSMGQREPSVLLDVDSLINSIVEDEVDAGNIASFTTSAGRDLLCHPQMLRRCVQNLVDNAIKYGGEAHLSTHADRAGLRIVIADPGPGIPSDQLEAVFEPMVRLETSRSRVTGGTGLGLTIARNLARQMGGTIILANRPEGGLECTLRFGSALAPERGM